MIKKKLTTLSLILICIVLILGIRIVKADTSETGTLKVHFQTNSSSIDMSGIKIRCVKTDDYNIDKSVVMQSSTQTFSNLPVGSYYVYIDKMPDGYEGLNLSTKEGMGYVVGTAEVTAGNTTQINKILNIIQEQNTETTGVLTINTLSGVGLKVIDSNGNVFYNQITTSNKVQLELETGKTYTVFITSLPSGYNIEEQGLIYNQTFGGYGIGQVELTSEGYTINKTQFKQSTSSSSTATGNLKIVVKDNESKNIPNTSISIQKNGSSSQISKETDSNGEITFSNLETGTYKIYITGVPNGYTLPNQSEYDVVEIKANETALKNISIEKIITTVTTKVTVKTVDTYTKNAVGPIVFTLFMKSGDNWVSVNNGQQYSTDSENGKIVLYLPQGIYTIHIIESIGAYPKEMQGNYDSETQTIKLDDEIVVSSQDDIEYEIPLLSGGNNSYKPATFSDLAGSRIGDKLYVYMEKSTVPQNEKNLNPLVFRDGFDYSHILCLNHKTSSKEGYFEVVDIVNVNGKNAQVLSNNKSYNDDRFLKLAYVLNRAQNTDWVANKDRIPGVRIDYQHYFWFNHDGGIAELLGLGEWTSTTNPGGYSDRAIQMNAEADSFIQNAQNENASIATNKNKIEYNEDTVAGPFNVEFIGNVKDITVKDENRNQINDVAFYEDKECTKQIGLKEGTSFIDITSQKDFYIKSNSGRIKYVNIRVQNNVLGCTLWFLKPYNRAANKGQNMMAFQAYTDATYANVDIEVEEPKFGQIQINKKDYDTGENLQGAEFILYKYDGNDKGWVTGAQNGLKTYTQSKNEAGRYKTDNNGVLLIDNLRKGDYYIYETSISSTEYLLSAQVGYDSANNWADVGSTSIEANKTKEETVYNRKVGNLQINKKDYDTEENLQGATFILYKKDGKDKGWVTENQNGQKEITQSKESAKRYTTNSNGTVFIDNLYIGNYDIYEITSPNDQYILSAQVGYDNTNKWVDVGCTSIEANKTNEQTVYNKKVGKLEISKKDYDTQESLSGAEFILYKYDGKDKGWVKGSEQGQKTYVQSKDDASKYTTNNNGVLFIDNLSIGKYYIYETKTPNEKYILEAQVGYDNTNGWVSAGDISIETNKTNKQTIYNRQLGKIIIKKVDADDNSIRLVAGFKVKTSKGWLRENGETYIYNSSYENATIFYSKDSGDEGIIDKLDLREQYTLYEVVEPEGYDLTKQQGYTNGAVPSETKQFEGTQTEIEFTFKNKKIVNVEGFVWVENPEGKANEYNDIYNSNSDDKLLSGIRVILHENSGTKETTTTNGYYKFSDIENSQLTNAYVEFIYDNKTYVACHTLVGNNNAINSKAKEHDMQVGELEDDNLTGTTGANPGIAVTEQGKLTAYGYDTHTYTYTNINLGLKIKTEHQHAVEETLEYVKVKMKGYTYTYKYGENPVTNSEYVPTINEIKKKTYTAKIYPSDIAYNVVNASATDKLEIYVVYKIGVKNTTTTSIEDIAVEQKLYLTELTNSFDTDRYELSTEENGNNDIENSQFKLWNIQENKAIYNLNDANSAYKDGIEKNETITSYIQFKIKEEAIQKMLNRTLSVEDIEEAPTVAQAAGFHEYLRRDQVWIDSSVRKYNGAKGNATSPYYLHKSTTKSVDTSNLYLKLTLGKSRTVSGTVFEDSISNTELKLGDGILNEQDPNRIKDVKVELLNADRNTVTSLYKVDDAGRIVYQEGTTLPKAETKSNEQGLYSFEGIVPGYYYIRFTYGDGSQKIISASGEEKALKSNDYKSTIINTEESRAENIIKDALEKEIGSQDAVNNANWYESLNNQYSVAVDDISMREKMDGYVYTEDKIVDSTGKEVTDFPTNIYSYTPMIGIPIEKSVNYNNDTDEMAIFGIFSFGIIEAPKTIVNVDIGISNVAITTQIGATIISENPVNSRSKYLTSLAQNEFNKSKYVKTEMNMDSIYGSDLMVRYELAVKNDSEIDYIETKDEEKGNYYKYGKISPSAIEKDVNIESVLNNVDSKYNIDTIDEKAKIIETGNEVTIVKGQNNTIDIKGWGNMERGATLSIGYDVTGLITKDDDTEYINKAAVSEISLDKLTTLNSGFIWPGSDAGNDARVTFTPPTGKDNRNVYLVSSIIGLIAICSGIVVLKKKVL